MKKRATRSWTAPTRSGRSAHPLAVRWSMNDPQSPCVGAVALSERVPPRPRQARTAVHCSRRQHSRACPGLPHGLRQRETIRSDPPNVAAQISGPVPCHSAPGMLCRAEGRGGEQDLHHRRGDRGPLHAAARAAPRIRRYACTVSAQFASCGRSAHEVTRLVIEWHIVAGTRVTIVTPSQEPTWGLPDARLPAIVNEKLEQLGVTVDSAQRGDARVWSTRRCG